MFERHDVIRLDLAEDTVAVIGELPSELVDPERLEQKLNRDRQKLYALVQYANCEHDRKAFIHGYFGLPYEAAGSS
jgi:ATP-dependent DNA helicase RecQ